jgi:hypothetical protein
MKFKTLLVAVAFLGSLSSIAQPASAPPSVEPPQFEVASVKMVDSRPHPVEDLVKGIGVFSTSLDMG